MSRRKLGKTDVEVSWLGFGCVQLTAHNSKKEAMNILECAFSEGITHFDVARSYGFGRAEGILSNFLRHKRDKVTVATKFGIDVPSGLFGNPKLISFAKTILSPVPMLLDRAKKRGASLVASGNFTVAAAQKSLEKSLQALKTDYVDLFLLHEATFADIKNDDLINMLQKQIVDGKIRSFGIASDFQKLCHEVSGIPTAYPILQFNENPFEQHMKTLPDTSAHGIITHSIFKPLEAITKKIDKNILSPTKYPFDWLENFSDPKMISQFLLHYAFNRNKNGCILFSSMKPENIKENARSCQKHLLSDEEITTIFEFLKMQGVNDY